MIRCLMVVVLSVACAGCQFPSLWDGEAKVQLYVTDVQNQERVLESAQRVRLDQRIEAHKHRPIAFPGRVTVQGDQEVVHDVVFTESFELALRALASDDINASASHDEPVATGIVVNSFALNNNHGYAIDFDFKFIEEQIAIGKLPSGRTISQPLIGNQSGTASVVIPLNQAVDVALSERHTLTVHIQARK